MTSSLPFQDMAYVSAWRRRGLMPIPFTATFENHKYSDFKPYVMKSTDARKDVVFVAAACRRTPDSPIC